MRAVAFAARPDRYQDGLLFIYEMEKRGKTC